jgi:pyruvate formate lyase activating enzyme
MKQISLEQLLAARTAPGCLFSALPDGRIQCCACAHRCSLKSGQSGICRVRFNQEGILRVPFNYTAGLQADPIEKKPFFHVLPGAKAFSFGMLGCNYGCDYCQNWVTSQTLKDPATDNLKADLLDIHATDLVRLALEQGCSVMTSTYNEPLITSEWAVAIFRLAKEQKLLTSYVSNGNATPEVLKFLRPHLDLFKVDLKAFKEETYRKTFSGSLQSVLETIEWLKKNNIWVEVVTLVVPGLNDSEKELKDIASFLVSISPDIPWHVTAFYPTYRMENRPSTDPYLLKRAWEIGKTAGLHYVYSGNRPGEVDTTENTDCPSCGKLLVERRGYQILQNFMGPSGQCPACRSSIPGRWKSPE